MIRRKNKAAAFDAVASKVAELGGMIDVHSHILPGIDDGSPSLTDSVELVRELAMGGVKEVIATPHYIDETIYTSPASANVKLMRELQGALDDAGIDVKVHLGNEIYVFPKIEEFVKRGEISALGGLSGDDAAGFSGGGSSVGGAGGGSDGGVGGDYLLVELPMSGDYPGYADIFLELLRDGYHVVLAHPERYTSFQNDYALVEELCEMGVLLQCNLGSFVGQYGKAAKKTALRLAKERKIFALGSDIHHLRGAEFMPEALAAVAKCYEGDVDLDGVGGADNASGLKAVLVGNPRKILGL